jgi:hypothetical protein
LIRARHFAKETPFCEVGRNAIESTPMHRAGLMLATLLLPSAALVPRSAFSVMRASPIMRDRGKENESRHRSKVQEKRASSQGARANGRTQPLKAQKAKAAKVESGAKRRLGAKSRQQRRGSVGKPREFRSQQARGYTRAAGNAAPVNEAMVNAILQQREAARRSRDYGSADRLRAMLRMMGVEVYDTEGVWRYVGPPEQSPGRSSSRDMFYLELFFRCLALYVAQNRR